MRRGTRKSGASSAVVPAAAAAAPSVVTAPALAPCSAEPSLLALNPAAVLNLVADVTHNFTDGLAIAAAFSAGQSVRILLSSSYLPFILPTACLIVH
jgi:zinc transporter ZupT